MSNTIVMRGYEIEQIITHSFTFHTSAQEDNARASARQVEKLAIIHNVYCDTPENIERYDQWQSSKSKWNIIVQGTPTDIGLFIANVKSIVAEVRT